VSQCRYGRLLPVNKLTLIGRPGGDDLPFVYSGTMVVRGQGSAQIKATGASTELGKIGKALRAFGPQATSLQKEVNLGGVVSLLWFEAWKIMRNSVVAIRDT